MTCSAFLAMLAILVAAVPGSVDARQEAAGADSAGPPPTKIAPDVPHGPLPPGTRYTFTRDSLHWSGAITLADLLSAIPGVFVARAGFLGQPEYVMYAGRGPGGLEVFFDGMPYYPFGGDSVYVDPGTIKVALLSRVDVEVLPGRLRVYLVSERHDTLAPRSYLRVMSGAFSTAQYAGIFQRRWSSGTSLDVGVDFTGSDGAPGVSRNDQMLDIFARVGYVPTERMGAVFEIRRQDQDRDRLPMGTLNSPPERKGIRSESIFRFFAGTDDDGFGFRFEGGFGSTSWSDSLGTLSSLAQAFGLLRYARPRFHADVSVRTSDARITRGARTTVGWVPLDGVVLSGEAEWQMHRGDRRSTYRGGSIGLYRGPFSIVGTVGRRDGLQAPALSTDTLQVTEDQSVRLGFVTQRLSGHAALVTRAAFEPLAPPDYGWWPSLGLTPQIDYLVVDGALRLVNPLTFSMWYSSPQDAVSGGLQPPAHSRAELTFRSKFWRTFRSGAYDFRASYRIESWGEGVAGLDANGSPVPMPGVTFHEIFMQIQLVDFMIFWNMRNARNSLAEYVPGLPYPRIAQTFGVQWTFYN